MSTHFICRVAMEQPRPPKPPPPRPPKPPPPPPRRVTRTPTHGYAATREARWRHCVRLKPNVT